LHVVDRDQLDALACVLERRELQRYARLTLELNIEPRHGTMHLDASIRAALMGLATAASSARFSALPWVARLDGAAGFATSIFRAWGL
jgi:hypothetical protein